MPHAPSSRRTFLRRLGASVSGAGVLLLSACGGTAAGPQGASTAATTAKASTSTAATAAPAPSIAASTTTTAAPATSAAAQPTAAPPANKGQRTITWSFWAVSQEQADNMLARVKDFNAAHPDVKVEAIFVQNGDYRSKIVSLISGGQPPTLTQVDAYDMAFFVQKQIIQRLDAIIKGDPSFKLDDFLPGSFLEDHQVFKGVYYAIPNSAESPRVLFYNKTKWQNAGLPLPNDLEAQGKWTWDAFLEAMQKVTTGAGGDRTFGTTAQLGFQPEPQTWILSNGGKSLSDDRKSFVGDAPETAEALQFQADLILKQTVAPRPSDNLGSTDPFISGRIASIEDGVWRAATLFTRPTFDYGIAPLPVSPKGVRKTVVKPNALTLAQGIVGQPQADAWELAKFIAGPAYQKPQIDVGQVITNQKSLVDYFLQKSPVHDAHVFVDAYTKGEVTPIPLIPQWQDYSKIYGEEFTKVRNGTATVADALSAIKSRANAILQQG